MLCRYKFQIIDTNTRISALEKFLGVKPDELFTFGLKTFKRLFLKKKWLRTFNIFELFICDAVCMYIVSIQYI